MSKLGYGIIWDDENALVTEFFDSEDKAKSEWEAISGEPWENLENSYHVQAFTPEEQEETKNWPEI